jgi:hypothetical protein
VSEQISASTPNFTRQQPQVLQRQKNQQHESAISIDIEATGNSPSFCNGRKTTARVRKHHRGNSPTNQQQRHVSADIQVQQPQQQSLKGLFPLDRREHRI